MQEAYVELEEKEVKPQELKRQSFRFQEEGQCVLQVRKEEPLGPYCKMQEVNNIVAMIGHVNAKTTRPISG